MSSPDTRRRIIKKYVWIGVGLAIAFIVLDYVTFSGSLAPFDIGTFKIINGRSYPADLDTFMVLLSDYGRELVWGAVTVTLLIFGGRRERKAALALLILFAVLAPIGTAIKDLEPRQRPYEALAGTRLLVGAENDSSFPSGHTLIVSGASIIALIYLERAVSVPLTVEAFLVSISRIFVGVHYPTDVIAGALLGSSVAFILSSQIWVEDAIFEKISNLVGRKTIISPVQP